MVARTSVVALERDASEAIRFGSIQRRLVLALACALLGTACVKTGSRAPRPASEADAPYDLTDPEDLAAVRDRYDGMPRQQRAELRAELATEYQRRATTFLDDGENERGYSAFTKLISLFDSPADLSSPPPPLVKAADLAARIRKIYAARGGDREASLALYVLAATRPDPAHAKEIDAIFNFSDELAVANYGPGAERARPIAILESVLEAAPFPPATERLIKLYRERHRAIDEIIRKGDLSYQLIGAHGQSVLRSAWHIVRVSALADKLESSLAAIATIRGFGEDEELRVALAAALGSGSPESAIALAKHFDSDEEEGRDLKAGLAVLSWALERTPNSGKLLRAAGRMASKNSQIVRGIRLLERGIGKRPNDRTAATELAELYEFRVTTLSLTGRPAAAAKVLGEFEAFYRRAASVWSDFTPDLANAYAAMGRGLLSLGELNGAEEILARSLGARTTLEALEHLGTLALRRDQFELAATTFQRALKLPGADPSVRFNRTKLMRLAGEALRGAGKPDAAYGQFLAALSEWRELRSSETYQLREPFAAEALVESGKLLWHIGKQDVALRAFAAAQDTAPDNASTYASIVSFLVVRDRYEAALDAYHRALGSADVSDYFKVYMSLWILAESRRSGRDIDPFVRDYLASREGRGWYDELARYASGRAKLALLSERATTRARRAELLYYKAVLSDPRASIANREALLRDVVASGMVMFFEYEMAKHWLQRGFAP